MREGSLLYLNPRGPVSTEPVIDDLTRRMTASYRGAQDTGVHWRGFHVCYCGVYSSNTDYILPGSEVQTNSLCIHYLAYHRDDIDQETLAFVAGLADGVAEPTLEELAKPKRNIS